MRISKIRLNHLVTEALAKGKETCSHSEKMKKLQGKNKIAVQFATNSEETEKKLDEMGYMLTSYSFLDEQGVLMGAAHYSDNTVIINKVVFIDVPDSDSRFLIIKVKESDLLE